MPVKAATVPSCPDPAPHRGDVGAEVAWVVGHPFQGRGYATEGALAMTRWLRGAGVRGLRAHIHPGHDASARVARALGLAATPETVDGELVWAGS
ncbi:GNAT family N-acetyltransferase [Streptomyces beihaiensis]|uniref:GNAT family N-acetyltransferase n=1 Tax=Streptomyces beihaiensis TaxID=2984495 RepID=A0ABT3TW63_9ACTN|nr:GNAT family N-acetyltransferase [Streptomyces beihaiensis]MCX3061294.1 GNAT family N-acetyltransferase [Streptomyces beihaiensis]